MNIIKINKCNENNINVDVKTVAATQFDFPIKFFVNFDLIVTIFQMLPFDVIKILRITSFH